MDEQQQQGEAKGEGCGQGWGVWPEVEAKARCMWDKLLERGGKGEGCAQEWGFWTEVDAKARCMGHSVSNETMFSTDPLRFFFNLAQL